MSKINDHRRVNDILLGPLERPTLHWLAAHMPAWVTPDLCTTVGVIGAVWIAVSYLLSLYDRNFLWLASLGFIINWFGDSMDGTLARHRQIERPIFGFFIDHTTDAFSATVIFMGLGLTRYVSFSIACLTLIAYLLLSVLIYLRTCVVSEFRISFSKLGPTEIRAVAILLNALMFFGGVRTASFTAGVLGTVVYSPYDILVALIGALMFGFFAVTALQETFRLAKENR